MRSTARDERRLLPLLLASLLSFSFLLACDAAEVASGARADTAVRVPSSALTIESTRGCLIDTDCAGGLFCFQNQCTFECDEEAACNSGSHCSQRGRCLGGLPTVETVGAIARGPGSLDFEHGAEISTQIAVQLEAVPENLIEIDPGQPFISVSLRTAAPIPGGAILYRIELEGEQGRVPRTLRAEGERDFRFQIPTGIAAGGQGEARLQRATLVTSVGGFQIDIVPRIALTGLYAGEIKVREFGGSGIPLRFGLRIEPAHASFEEAEFRYLLLPSGPEELLAPLRTAGVNAPWVERPLEYDAEAGVYFARFAHGFDLGDASLFRRGNEVVRSIRIEIEKVEGKRVLGAAADRWQGLFDARSADGVVAPGLVTLAGQMVATRIGSLPAAAATPIAGQATAAVPRAGRPLEISTCGPAVFSALVAAAAPIEQGADPLTADSCPGIFTLAEFVEAPSETRGGCAVALADAALQGPSTAAQVRAFLDDAQPNPGGLSFGEFLNRCAAGQGYCVPSPEIVCTEQLLAFAYQAQGDELSIAGTLLNRYQAAARESYLGRQLAAFQVDTNTRLDWLRKSEAPLFLAAQLQSYNEDMLARWEKQVLQAHFDVLSSQFAPSSLEVLGRAPTDPLAISARKQMLLEQAQTWQGAMEALQIAGARWNGLFQDDGKRARAAGTVRTRAVDLYLSAAVLAHLNRSSGSSAVSSVFGSGFAALLRSLEELSLPFDELIFMRDAEVVVSRSVDPQSSSSTLLGEREQMARRAVADAQDSVDRVLADVQASEVNARVLTDRMRTQLEELRSELVMLCGLPAGCSPSDMNTRQECQVQVAVGRCGFVVDPFTGKQDSFDPLEDPENVSEGGAVILSFRQALLDLRIAEESYRANEERARIEHENAEAFARKTVEWSERQQAVSAEVDRLLEEIGALGSAVDEAELDTIEAMQAARAAAYQQQKAEIARWSELRLKGVTADMASMTSINTLQQKAASLTLAGDEADRLAELIADGMPKAVGLSNDVSAPARLIMGLSTFGGTTVLRSVALSMEVSATRIQAELDEAQARREATLSNLSDLADLDALQTENALEALAASLRRHELETNDAVGTLEALIDALRRNLEMDLAHERDLFELRDRRDRVRIRVTESPALRVAILRHEVIANQRIQQYMQVVQRAELLHGRYLAMSERLEQLDVLIASPATIFAFANRLARAESRVDRAKGLLYDWVVALEYYAVRPFISQRLAVLLARNPSQLEAIANELVRLQRVCGGLVNYEIVDLSLRDDLLRVGFDLAPTSDLEGAQQPGEKIDAAERFRAVLRRGNVPIDTQVRYSTDERIGDLIASREVLAASFDLRLGDFANLPLTCNAKLASIDLQLVGEGLGKNVRPTVSVLYDGTSTLRSCQPNIDTIVAGLAPGTTAFGTVTQFRTAGRSVSPIATIGSFGAADSANRGLEGLPLASSYTILIDPAAGENKRINWNALEDVEIRLTWAYQDLFPAGQCE